MTTRKKSEHDVRRIAEDTEETRSKIGEDLRQLGEKLKPENIKEGIKAEAREAIEQAKDTAREKVQNVKESVTEAGRTTLGFASDNAIPLAMIGAGVGWLIAKRRRTNGGWRRQGEWRRQEGGAELRGPELRQELRGRVERAGYRTRELARENPLPIAALAVAAGVGVGLALPVTRKEEEVLGPARDKLVGGAKDTARQLGQTAKETAREIKEKVSEPMTH